MLQKLFQRTKRGNILQAGLQHHKFENIPFKQSFNNLTKSYDLRMWYVNNSPHESKNLQFVHEMESLHNELNYQVSRCNIMKSSFQFGNPLFCSLEFLFRIGAFLVGWALFYQVYQLPRTYDWQDTQEPKHQLLAYGDLEESGDEGADD